MNDKHPPTPARPAGYRRFPHATFCVPDAGERPRRKLTADDYPLVEVVDDDLLGGYWLYLHPTPDGAPDRPRFHPRGVPVRNACIIMLNSWFARTEPPLPTTPSRTPVVFTAADHLNR